MAARGDEPRMVTVFASELVDEMVGEFAAWKHERWKVTDAEQVLSVLRTEDAEAAQALGSSLRWLGLPDAIYRGDRYRSDPELFGVLKGEELELAAHLAEEIRQLPEWRDGTRVFVPLGVGSHVDHQLVFEAGRHLASEGVEVYAYEDCPYAIHTPAGVASHPVDCLLPIPGPGDLSLHDGFQKNCRRVRVQDRWCARTRRALLARSSARQQTMMASFETLEQGVTLVRLNGRLDAAAAPNFLARLKASIDEGKTRLALDLAAVPFIDSTGLGSLVSALKAARRAEGDVRLIAPSQQVQKLLQLTTLNRVFAIAETPENAWA
jgi:anti-anti-sigma factor